MKKRILAVISVIIIAATLFGCSNKAIDVDTHSTESASQSTTAKTTKSVSSATKAVENSSAATTTQKEENSSTKPSKAPAAKTTAKSTTQEEYDESEYTKPATKAAAQTTTETTTKETTKVTVKKQCKYYCGSNGGHYRNISEIESHFNKWYIEQLDSGRNGYANYVRYGCDCGGYEAEFYFYDE